MANKQMNFGFEMSTRISWGSIKETLLAELASLQAGRVLIVTDPGLLATGLPDMAQSVLVANGVSVSIFGQVASNPGTKDVAGALSASQEFGGEAIIAIGGGSCIDTAKATAMLLTNGGDYLDYQWGGRVVDKLSQALLAIPTTAGTGSEVSKVSVISDSSQPFKKGVVSHLMYPHAALIDPTLTIGLPPHLTAATGMDALVHALEAYIGLAANPISDLFALESLRLISSSLLRATRQGDDIDARSNMMLAAIYGGIAMDQSGLGLVHALSGGLCSHLHLHHGLANALLLPSVLEFNLDSISESRLQILNQAFGLHLSASGHSLVDALTSLITRLSLPTGLAGHEIADADWAAIADESMKMVMIHNNPRAVSIDDCMSILEQLK